jgi:hypothetical protein
LVQRGGQLSLRSQWTVLSDPESDIRYYEWWDIQKRGAKSTKIMDRRSGTVAQGSYESGIDFTVPSDWPPGTYLAAHHLTVAGREVSGTDVVSIN